MILCNVYGIGSNNTEIIYIHTFVLYLNIHCVQTVEGPPMSAVPTDRKAAPSYENHQIYVRSSTKS